MFWVGCTRNGLRTQKAQAFLVPRQQKITSFLEEVTRSWYHSRKITGENNGAAHDNLGDNGEEWRRRSGENHFMAPSLRARLQPRCIPNAKSATLYVEDRS